jgi:hypothetical protein
MEQHNPYSPPQAVLDKPGSDVETRINSLAVSETWKRRFIAIARAGGPSLPDMKTMDPADRKALAMFNFLGFLFGPFYYLAKGMWKKALAMGAAAFTATILFQLAMAMMGMEVLARASGFAVAALFAVRANIDYYKMMVQDDHGWW